MIPNRYRKCSWLQTLSFACTARCDPHKFFILCLGCFRISLTISALYVLNNTFKCNIVEPFSALSKIMHIHILTIRTVNQYILNLLRIFLKRRIQCKLIFFRKCFQYGSGKTALLAGRLPAHDCDCTFIDTQALIRNDQIRIKFHLISKSGTLRAGPERIVK